MLLYANVFCILNKKKVISEKIQKKLKKMAAEQREEAGLNPQQIGIMQLNNLTYKLEPDLAVVTARNVQSSYFLSASYAPGSQMVLVCNTGSAFVNLKQSVLVLEVQNTSAGGTNGNTSWFGLNGGSACNFINQIRIIAKNGVVLEFIQNANVLAAKKVAYAYSTDWKNSVGQAMGIYPTAAALGWTYQASGAGSTVRFEIPLYAFSSLCDNMNTLCPPQLLSGARFEILLENPNVAMIQGVSDSANVQNYAVTACRIDFESYIIVDSVLRVTNQVAASQGLEVVSCATVDTQAQRTSASITVDVARSCSRALSLLYVERIPASALATGNANPPATYPVGAFFDRMASAPLQTVAGVSSGTYTNLPMEWQVRVGVNYFPQQSLRGAGTAVGQADNDLYMQTLRSFNKLCPQTQNTSSNCSLVSFRGSATLNGSEAAYGLDLQRSAILTSGIPLSNARLASVYYATNFSQITTFAYLVDVYLTYQILIRTFLSQVVLEV